MLSACGESRRRRDISRLGQAATREKPIISLDYVFPGIKKGKDKGEKDQLEAEALKAGLTPQLVMHVTESKGIYA